VARVVPRSHGAGSLDESGGVFIARPGENSLGSGLRQVRPPSHRAHGSRSVPLIQNPDRPFGGCRMAVLSAGVQNSKRMVFSESGCQRNRAVHQHPLERLPVALVTPASRAVGKVKVCSVSFVSPYLSRWRLSGCALPIGTKSKVVLRAVAVVLWRCRLPFSRKHRLPEAQAGGRAGRPQDSIALLVGRRCSNVRAK
jgi:hypothetical protein